MSSANDNIFVRIALEKKLLTKQQLQQLQSIRNQYLKKGQSISIALICIKSGLLNQQQVASVYQSMKQISTLQTYGDTPTPNPSHQTPQFFGKYKISEELGRGGMGVVYKAYDTELERWVALKQVLAGQYLSEVQLQRFKQEARSTAKLHHPHIVKVYEVGDTVPICRKKSKIRF